MSASIIAHIDMDAFFAAVEQRDNPTLRGKPVIVGADPKEGKGRGVVSTCSYEARKFGIHSAMPISIAYRRCPHGIFLPGNYKKYSEASRQIFRIIDDFTPDVEAVSIDEAFLDITGCTHLHQGIERLARNLKDKIKKEVGLTASIGIAPNKMTAKIASDYSKPDGLLIIEPKKVLIFLWPLPVEKLWGVGKKTQAALNTMGITTIEDLARYPVEKLAKQFGEYGLHVHLLANGVDDRVVHQDDETKSVSHEHTFDVDTHDPEEIKEILLMLGEKVSRRLRKLELKGKTVSIKIRTKGFHTYTRADTLPDRTNFFDDIFRVSQKLFEEFDTKNKQEKDIRLLGVRVSNFHDAYYQESLFENPVTAKKEKIHAALDVIKDRFGEESISRGK